MSAPDFPELPRVAAPDLSPLDRIFAEHEAWLRRRTDAATGAAATAAQFNQVLGERVVRGAVLPEDCQPETKAGNQDASEAAARWLDDVLSGHLDGPAMSAGNCVDWLTDGTASVVVCVRVLVRPA